MPNGKPGRPAKYTPEFKRNAVEYYFAGGKTQKECAASVEYVEGYYNRRRPHSTIGYEVPTGKMQAFFDRLEAMCSHPLPMAA